jgi:hypothetical protein
MTDLSLERKRVPIRGDLNVPVKTGRVTSAARLEAALPTLKLALEQRARVLVMSHLGRPPCGCWSSSSASASAPGEAGFGLKVTMLRLPLSCAAPVLVAAGKGAAIGAVVGTVAGGVHQQRKDQAVQVQTHANQQQAQQALASYNRAYAACLEGRGYTVR